MAKKVFTDESLKTLVDESKSYVDNIASGKANTSHSHSISNVINLQSTLDGKAASSHNHSATNINSGTLSSDRLPTVPISKGGTGATSASAALTNLGLTATATELNYTDGVTSNIQTQLNGKASSSHTHNYAGSGSAGGSATSAVKLDGFSSSTTSQSSWGELAKTDYTPVLRMDTSSSGSIAFADKGGQTYFQVDGLIYQNEGKNLVLDSANYSTYAAKASHNHSASNINSGTLSSDRLPTVPISKGGTGATTAAGVLTNLGITATSSELNYMDGVTSNVQTQLNGKSATHSHPYVPLAGGTMTGRLTADGKVTMPSTAGSWISGATSGNPSIQISTQQTTNSYHPYFGVKSSGGHTVNMGGLGDNFGFYGYKSGRTENGTDWSFTMNASSGAINSTGQITSPKFVGALSGNATTATTATKLGTDAGSATQPVYFSGGKPVATTYTLGKSVPADAVFTDTNTWRPVQNNLTSSSTTDALSAAQGAALKTLVDGKAASSHNHAASNITSGTLSSDRLPTVPVSKGGTGSTTAAGARANLGTLSAVNANGYYGMGLPDGTTSNWLRTTQNGIIPYQSGGSGSLGTESWPFNNAYIKTVTGSLSGNASTATKLANARTISLGTGVTGTATSFNGSSNITIPVTDIKESYLSWGGKNLAGSVSPIDAASSNIHSANRFAFANASGITIEYSTNGSTYSAYSTTDSAKVNLVSGNGNVYYIGARSTSTTVNDKLRITLNATNMGVYTRLRKLLINISTSYATGSNVIIEKAMKGSETTFTTVGTYPISGWSGWNSIPINAAFGGGSTQTGNVAALRLTFGITGVNTSQTSNALQVIDIIGIGDTYWSYPSTMAKTGHLYSYDSNQNATFPATVTSPTLSGTTFSGSGVATVAEVKSYLGI